MIKFIFKSALFILLFLGLNHSYASIRLPKLVSDSMVIQRDVKIKIWGWADANEKLKVSFKGKNYSATANANGEWMVWIAPTKAGGPYSMKITGKNESLMLNGILVGDVWLCAGQSNMVHNMELHSERYKKDIETANFPMIRQFLVPTNPVLGGPAEDIPTGSWKPATPKNVLKFSVIAYYFGKKLYEKYNIPIGLINTSVGGTPIEAWTSEEGLKAFPDLINTIQKNKDTAYVNHENRRAGILRKEIEKERPADAGTAGPKPWYDPTYQPTNWHFINIPGYWEDQGIKDLNGVVWYRNEINVPASMTGKPAKIAMGRIVDADYIYINGKMVGNKTYQYPQRRYDIPADLLKAGKNTIVIRVINYSGKGGFVPDKPYYIATAKDTLDLKGYWQYKVGAAYSPSTINPGGISAQNQPASLYNGMVAPFIDFPIKGALWYQGESNTWHADQYEKLLPALIYDWRKKWNSPNLPVLFVQLPNFMETDYLPCESSWAVLREGQRKSLRVPNTAMAVALDLGEWNDIHPDNKKPIGDRLALAAENLVYGDKGVIYSGPSYTAVSVTDNKVTLTFNHTGSGIVSQDGEPLRWFAVAGEDKKFTWADTKIDGNKIIVWSDQIKDPVYVRYAWADNPVDINFYNKEGLPASPFEVQVKDLSKLWHGKKAAVVLTYDDALEVHLDNAIPMLDSLGLKASFYLTADFPGCKNRLEDWKRAARNGHELGNHTLFHPCDGTKGGRSWITAVNDLSKYTTAQIVREIEMTNVFLQSLDGKTERTFAYTCGDTETSEGSFVNAIKDKFVSMRGVHASLNKLETLNLNNLNCYVVDKTNEDNMISWAEKARQENALLVILFHGVGGGHSGNVDLAKHHALLKYLKSHPDDFWVTTLIDASKHCLEQIKK